MLYIILLRMHICMYIKDQLEIYKGYLLYFFNRLQINVSRVCHVVCVCVCDIFGIE